MADDHVDVEEQVPELSHRESVVSISKDEAYSNMFESLDYQGTGVVSVNDVRQALVSLGMDPDDDYFVENLNQQEEKVQQGLAQGYDLDGFMHLLENYEDPELELIISDDSDFAFSDDSDHSDIDEGMVRVSKGDDVVDGAQGSQPAGEEGLLSPQDARRPSMRRASAAKHRSSLSGGPELVDWNARYVQAMNALFHQMDVDRSGHIQLDEIERHMRSSHLRGTSVSEDEMGFYFALIETVTELGDEGLDKEAFFEVCEEHNEFVKQYAQHGSMMARPAPSRPSLAWGESRAGSVESHSDLLDMLDAGTRARYQAVYDHFDHDGNGLLMDDDVTHVMQNLGRVPTADENEFLFALLEAAGNKGLTFEEYVNLLESGTLDADIGSDTDVWQARRLNPSKMRLLNRSRGSRVRVSRADMRAGGINRERGARLMEKTPSRGLLAVGRRAVDKGGRPAPGEYEISVDDDGDPNLVSVQADEKVRWRAVFNKLDADKDGRVTVDEFRDNIKHVIGRQPQDFEVEGFLKNAGGSHEDRVDFDEFLALMTRTKTRLGLGLAGMELWQYYTESTERQRRIRYDEMFAMLTGPSGKKGKKSSKGGLTATGIHDFFSARGKPVPLERCEALIDRFSSNGKSISSTDDFAQMMDRLKIT